VSGGCALAFAVRYLSVLVDFVFGFFAAPALRRSGSVTFSTARTTKNRRRAKGEYKNDCRHELNAHSNSRRLRSITGFETVSKLLKLKAYRGKIVNSSLRACRSRWKRGWLAGICKQIRQWSCRL